MLIQWYLTETLPYYLPVYDTINRLYIRLAYSIGLFFYKSYLYVRADLTECDSGLHRTNSKTAILKQDVIKTNEVIIKKSK